MGVVNFLALTVPRFIQRESTTGADACVNNLRLIDGIKQQWAIEQHKATNDVPTWNDLQSYFPFSVLNSPFWTNGMLVCPGGGTYTIGAVSAPPTCSIGGPQHTLQ
jgi:hypothetical protein